MPNDSSRLITSNGPRSLFTDSSENVDFGWRVQAEALIENGSESNGGAIPVRRSRDQYSVFGYVAKSGHFHDAASRATRMSLQPSACI